MSLLVKIGRLSPESAALEGEPDQVDARRRAAHDAKLRPARAQAAPSGVAREPLATQKVALTHLAQKYQDGEGELQPPPVPYRKSRVSKLSSEADSEKHKGDHGRDAPGSQNGSDAPGSRNGRVRTLLFRELLWDDRIIHGRRILTWLRGVVAGCPGEVIGGSRT